MKRILVCLLFCLPLSALAGPITVTGTVTDAADNSPLPGAVIRENGYRNHAVADTLGRYTIRVDASATLVFSFLGFEQQEIPVEGRTRIDVGMKQQEPMTLCDETVTTEVNFAEFGENSVVIGYGTTPPTAGLRIRRVANVANSEEYARFSENRFRSALDEPLSTFALEADGAAYANCRRMISAGKMPPADAVRIEEFVNYFPYDYAAPVGDEPLSLTAQAGPCPWSEGHRLVRIALRAAEIDARELPPSNIVYLIDVSGSMRFQMPLVKASMKMLTDNLRAEDRVSVVTYASGVTEVLTAVPGSERRRIKDAVDALVARGATSGGAGLQLAYEVALRNFIPGGNNRIVLCTDGDFNVGASSDEDIEALIEQKRKETGVVLSVLGYGMGNYKDRKMQIIAEKGNGNYAYIDDMAEASKVLFHEFGATFRNAAQDVKLQVEFNPAQVASYRLVGYESRLLANEDFNDDRKDAGEIGAGHCVTALYEVVPAGMEEHAAGTVDPLRYQSRDGAPVVTIPSAEMLAVKLRYKLPGEERSRLRQVELIDGGDDVLTGDFAFAAAVAMYGQLLKVSDFRGEATWDDVMTLAESGLGSDPGGYRRAFVDMVRATKYLK